MLPVKIKNAFLTAEWGGQSVVSEQIYNWIGTASLSGNELAENFKSMCWQMRVPDKLWK